MRVYDFLVSCIVQQAHHITTRAMLWRKILLYHTVTSLTPAVTGFSPKSTKACTTKDEITSPETSLV